MTRFRILLALLLLAGLVTLAGCCHSGHTSSYISAQPYACYRCGDGPVPPRQPASAVPAPPGRLPPGPATPPGSTFTPPSRDPVPPPTDSAPPPPIANVPPATNGPSVRLGPPAPLRRDSARAPSAESKEPPVASVPSKPGPSVDEERDPPLPIDLPGYAMARPNVASGLQPFPDGITWLKERGYKTVLHLLPPGEDNTAARRQFEKKGLRYLSLEVSPASLSKEVLESFKRIVTDTSIHPLFVYDKDGSSAGGLWYLHFRLHLDAGAEKAKAEAQRLGLRFDDDVEHRTMWIAVQKLAGDLK